MTEYESQVVASVGRIGSGKSQLLWELFVSLAPRVLTIGHVPQDLARDPNVIKTRGRTELYAALERASGYKSWHIAAAIDPAQLDELFTLLAPPLEDPPESSLSLALGGIAIDSGEAYDLFPVGYTPPPRLAAIRRSRHYSIDFYLGSQRPHSVHREVTAQAHLIFAFAQSEPRDIKFLAESVSRPFAEQVRALVLEEHRCLVHDRRRGTSMTLNADYSPAGRLDPMAGAAGAAGR